MCTHPPIHHLVRQLDDLALPIGIPEDDVECAQTGVAPHDDPTDCSPTRRDHPRRRARHASWTTAGRLRHLAGHRYFGRLVGQTDDVAEFQRLFHHHRPCEPDVGRNDGHDHTGPDPTRFVTSLAASSPSEDWAETFAHYLHLLDVEVDPSLGGDGSGSLVDEKLAFVHRQVEAHTARDRFYADR